MHFRLHLSSTCCQCMSIQNDSIKGEIEEACYAALEGASKISFHGALKTT